MRTFLKHNGLTALVLGLMISAQAGESLGASFSVKSPGTQVDLIELYTSEGCSSCPPADRWVSSLEDNPGLWRKFIPMAFHVDYWDYIGWVDRFASPAFTARQYTYAAQQSMRTVYTPGFFRNGKEWRWRGSRPGENEGGRFAGVLSLEVKAETAEVHFATSQQDLVLSANLALLGFDISTQVKAGENNGRKLTHNFVVLSVEQVNLQLKADGYEGLLPVPTTNVEAPRYALVAWISSADNQDPIQAVGGWLSD